MVTLTENLFFTEWSPTRTEVHLVRHETLEARRKSKGREHRLSNPRSCAPEQRRAR